MEMLGVISDPVLNTEVHSCLRLFQAALCGNACVTPVEAETSKAKVLPNSMSGVVPAPGQQGTAFSLCLHLPEIKETLQPTCIFFQKHHPI